MAARENFVSWDSYFMLSAKLAAERSKDPSTQVGAVVVNEDNRIVATGYNGLPRGFPDDSGLWGKGNPEFMANKYPFVVHAEANAVTNWYHRDPSQGHRMYVTLFPCNECAKLIVQSGVKEVIFANYPREWKEAYDASMMIFELAEVKLRLYSGTRSLYLELPEATLPPEPK
jgi:dCMP deaminase